MITKRLLTLELVLATGLGSIFLLPHSGRSSPAGVAVMLPDYFAGWIGHEESITPRELEGLAKDTRFARKTYTNVAGEKILVSIVMSGEDMASSIHRPERCLAAQGWSVRTSDKRTIT